MMTTKKTTCNVRVRREIQILGKIRVHQEELSSMILFNKVVVKIVRNSRLNRDWNLLYKSYNLIRYADGLGEIARNENELMDIDGRATLHIN